tara:strand:+ start:339 stop:1769 length:1431 start_codon:yes stop_codon:yes gene_type:complete
MDGATEQKDTKSLVEAINAFCEKFGIAQSTFGRLSVNDGKLVNRISKGSWISPTTEERVQEFMKKAEKGEIVLRGRPRRKKTESNAYTMAELVNRESTVRTPGSFVLHEQRQRSHVFAATTNESWVKGDIIAEDIVELASGKTELRLFFSPMDSGVTIARALRAIHAHFPDLPVLLLIKGWGLEDLRNTMGRMVDRLSEHPKTVLVLTNLYTREAVTLSKTAKEGPDDLIWRDVSLTGTNSYDFQKQTAKLFPILASEWTVQQGLDDFPVYTRPSVVTIYREDQRKALEQLIPRDGQSGLEFDYCFLNHPFLHSHTMKFRIDYILQPVVHHLAAGGQIKVVQSFGSDPAHEIVRKVWPDEKIENISRHDIISALKKTLGEDLKDLSFHGMTDARSLFRFDMHTLPVITDAESATLSLQSAWSNAVFFTQMNEEMAEKALRDGRTCLCATRDVLRQQGGLWFVNESFSIFRKPPEQG